MEIQLPMQVPLGNFAWQNIFYLQIATPLQDRVLPLRASLWDQMLQQVVAKCASKISQKQQSSVHKVVRDVTYYADAGRQPHIDFKIITESRNLFMQNVISSRVITSRTRSAVIYSRLVVVRNWVHMFLVF